jgi:hypothetical protein
MELVRSINLLTDNNYHQLGTIVKFSEPFECYATDDGKIHIGHIVIDTNPEFNEEDPCDEADRLYYEAINDE